MKPPVRRADVDRAHPGDVDAERVERAGELLAAARDEALALGDLDGGVVVD